MWCVERGGHGEETAVDQIERLGRRSFLGAERVQPE